MSELITCRAFEIGREVKIVTSGINFRQMIEWENTLLSLPRKEITFKDIKATLHKAVGIEIPEVLVEELGLGSARWQMPYDRQVLTAVFLGVDVNFAGTRAGFENAGSIVEFTSVFDFPPSINIDSIGTIKPKRLSVAGNMIDGKGNIRAVGFSYAFRGMGGGFDLTTAKVTVSDKELPLPYGRLLEVYPNKWHALYPPESTNVLTGGIITPAMVKQTSVGKELAHRRVVSVLNWDGSIRLEALSSNERNPIDPGLSYERYPVNPGFSAEGINDTQFRLSFSPLEESYDFYLESGWIDKEGFISLKPWEIVMPYHIPATVSKTA